MTARSVHDRFARALLLTSEATLGEAFLAHPVRFKGTNPGIPLDNGLCTP